jgi:hypothetical protein
VPLALLVQVAGSRWKAGDGFAGGKELAALDEHQVRSWTSWHRWTILALLAHAFLSVLASQAAASHPDDEQLIPLTRHEIRRLLTGLSRRWTHQRHSCTGPDGDAGTRPPPGTVTTADEPKHPHDHELSLEY